MRVAIIAPPYPLQEAPAPPLGISYVAAAFEGAGAEVKIFDYIVSKYSREKLAAQLAEFQPEVVGSGSVTMNFPDAAGIIKAVKEIDPSIITMMGGPHVTFDEKNTLTNYPEIDFLVASLVFFLTWSLIGLYRNMRSHLQMKNGCMVWIGFEITFMVYIAGFTALLDMCRFNTHLARPTVCFWFSLLLSYATLFGESKNIVDFRRLSDRIVTGRWKDVQYHLPLW